MPAKRKRRRVSEVRPPALRNQVVIRLRQNVDDDLRLATSRLPRAVLSDMAREGLRYMLGLTAAPATPTPQIGINRSPVIAAPREKKEITEADFDRLGEMMGNG